MNSLAYITWDIPQLKVLSVHFGSRYLFWGAISLTDTGGHFCWPCDQHLYPLILAKPRESKEDQLPLSAHACLCWPPRGHCICPSYPQYPDWGETAYFHHHTVYRHGDCIVLWGAHYCCVAVPQDTVSVQGFWQVVPKSKHYYYIGWAPEYYIPCSQEIWCENGGCLIRTLWCLALLSLCRVGVEDDPQESEPVGRLVCEIPVQKYHTYMYVCTT